MYLVCDPIAVGMVHVPFNAALLKTICFAFPNDVICFYAENSHLEHVREEIGEKFAASIVWRKMVPPFWRKLVPPLRNSGFYTRLFSDFKIVKHLLKELNENPKKDVLVIIGNTSLLWALKHYVGTKHKDKRVQIINHGNFTTLSRIPLRGILNPFYYIGSLKTALKLSFNEKFQHIVLEEAVRDSILKYMPALRSKLFVLDHPIPANNQPVEINNFRPPIQFGFLGHTADEKGFSKYLAVASDISKRFPGQVKFHLIGRISEKQRRANRSKMAFLSETPRMERLSRNEYVNRLKSMHFVCLFYDKFYDFCASGVLMDSIAWEKPIIATQLPMFKTIQQRFGDIGYLCRNNEFSETISSIIQTLDSDRYKRQVINMRSVKASRKPETIAKKYLELVNCLHKQ